MARELTFGHELRFAHELTALPSFRKIFAVAKINLNAPNGRKSCRAAANHGAAGSWRRSRQIIYTNSDLSRTPKVFKASSAVFRIRGRRHLPPPGKAKDAHAPRCGVARQVCMLLNTGYRFEAVHRGEYKSVCFCTRDIALLLCSAVNKYTA